MIQPGPSSPTRRLTTESREVGQPVATPTTRRDARRVESEPVLRDNSPRGVSGERRSPQGRDVEARRSGGEGDGRRSINPRARQESLPQDVSPRRSENTSDVTTRRGENLPIDATPRWNDTPRDVTPRRAEVERPNKERAPVREDRPQQDRPQVESRRSEEPARQAPPPSVDRGGDRGGDRGSSGRSDAPSGRSDGGGRSGGGWSGGGSGGGGGVSSGGGRRH